MDRKFGKSWSKIPTKRNNNYLLDSLPSAIFFFFFLAKISIIKMIKLKYCKRIKGVNRVS